MWIFKERATVTLFIVACWCSPFASAGPEIRSSGSGIQLKIDDGGDLQVLAGSNPAQSILEAISQIPGIQDNVSIVLNAIQQINTNLSSVATSLSLENNALGWEHLTLKLPSISGIQNNVSAIAQLVSAVNQSVTNANHNSMFVRHHRAHCAIGSQYIATSDAIPLNSEPIPTPRKADIAGMCNLTLGGTCRVMCKQGYRANSSVNVAFQKTAVGFLRTASASTDANLTLDGGTSDGSRYVAQCANIVCWVVVDLHQPYMITEFDWLNGHSGCVPGGRTCNYDAHCKHYVQIWSGPDVIPGLRTIGADMSANWTTIASYLQPSSHGINHDAFTPVNARYVKLLVDNRRDVATCFGGSYLRIREIQVFTSSTKAYTCTAAGLVPVDSTPLECDVTNGTVV